MEFLFMHVKLNTLLERETKIAFHFYGVLLDAYHWPHIPLAHPNRFLIIKIHFN
jgi:hypothetical protein